MKRNFTLFFVFCLHLSLSAEYVWLNPEQVFDQGSFLPRIALDSSGNAVAIAIKATRDGLVLQAATKLSDQPWDAPVFLSQPKRKFSQYWMPKLVLDSTGFATAIWVEEMGSAGYGRLQVSSGGFGRRWTPPFCLSQEDSFLKGCDSAPQLVVDVFGNVTALWKRKQGDEVNIFSATKPAHEDWSIPMQISQNGLSSFPCLAVGLDGQVVAAWAKFNGTRSSPGHLVIQTSTKSLNQAWSSPMDVSVNNKGSWFIESKVGGSDPKLAINRKGDAVIVWEGKYEGGGIYIAEGKLHEEWNPFCQIASGVCLGSRAAIDSLGNVLVVWQEYFSKAFGLEGFGAVKCYSKLKEEGWFNFLYRVKVLTEALGPLEDFLKWKSPATNLQVNFDSEDYAIAVWTKYSDDNTTIQAATKPPNGEWSFPVDLVVARGWVTNLQVEIAPNRDVFLIWEEGPEEERVIKSMLGKTRRW